MTIHRIRLHITTTRLRRFCSSATTTSTCSCRQRGRAAPSPALPASSRSASPQCKIVGVDPIGSILAQPESLNTNINEAYKVEGIGYDFIPKVLDRSVVDEWVKSDDRTSFLMARRLIREEGLLVGGSSGSAVVAAIAAARNLKAGQRCVVILPDSTRNYMTKFLNEDWMLENNFVDEETEARRAADIAKWGSATVGHLNLPAPVTTTPQTSAKECVRIMSERGFDHLPVVRDGKVVGLVALGNLHSRITRGTVHPEDPASKCMFKFSRKRSFEDITVDTPLSTLTSFFEKNSIAFVTEKNTDRVIRHVLTKIDLLSFLVKHQQ
eukprot:Opistho-2@48718